MIDNNEYIDAARWHTLCRVTTMHYNVRAAWVNSGKIPTSTGHPLNAV